MAAPKTVIGEFDLASFLYNVTDRGKIPHDAVLGYQLKRRNAGGQWTTDVRKEGFYTIPAHPDAVVQLEQQLVGEGLRGWWAILFHPHNSPSKTLWRWELDLGEDTAAAMVPAQHQAPPIAYHRAPTTAAPQPIPIQVTPQAQHDPRFADPRYGNYLPPAQPSYGDRYAPPYREQLYDPRYGYGPPPAPPSPPAVTVESPELATLRAELAEMRRERAEDRRIAAEEKREREQKAREDTLLAEIRKVREESDQKLERLVSRLDANAAPKASTADQIIAMVTALAPHFVELRKSSTEAESAARGREDKLFQLMLERRTDPMVEKVLAKFDDLQAATKGQPLSEQVAVMQTVSQAMFGSFSMSMKMLEQMAESMPQASPVKEIAGELLVGLKGMLDTYLRGQQLKADRQQIAQQQKQLPALQQQAAPAATEAAATDVIVTPPPAESAPDIRTRDGMLLYMRQQGAPEDWCQKEWAGILSGLVRKEDAEEMGQALAFVVYGKWKMDALPPAIAACETVEGFPKPWPIVLKFMPLERDAETQQYLDTVLAHAARHYAAMRKDDDAPDDAADDGSSNGASAEPIDVGNATVVPAVPGVAA